MIPCAIAFSAAAASAEVMGERIEEGAIVAAGEISEGAAQLRDEMAEDEAAESATEGEVEGTD